MDDLEEKLFRAMTPIARRLVEARRAAKLAVDAEALAAQLIHDFARSVSLGPHTEALRARLKELIALLAAQRGT